jgi:glycosyltransferase involved in cell wall biosynthesis
LAQAHIGVTSLPAPDNVKFQASSPIKLFEYMAAGLPMLATSNVCHTDVVGDGRYTFWADEATPAALLTALRTIWQARATLRTLGQEAQQAVHQWTWEAAGGQLDDALRRGLMPTTRPAARQYASN